MNNIKVIETGNYSLTAILRFHANYEALGMARSCCGYACNFAD